MIYQEPDVAPPGDGAWGVGKGLYSFPLGHHAPAPGPGGGGEADCLYRILIRPWSSVVTKVRSFPPCPNID